jgi:quinol monooxygenase YgiN
MHTRIGTFDAPPERLDEVVALFRDRIFRAFSKHEGFLGYQAFVDREKGRFVGLSFWATRSALEGSGETARQARSEAASLGAVTVGDPQLLEQAFDARL